MLPNQNHEIQQASENILHVFVVDICKVINKILRKKNGFFWHDAICSDVSCESIANQVCVRINFGLAR